ncbi:TetR/AcrR family transcriptional regulator [Nocardiopsis tropica]|uniref:TetR/AcrR family transcriptional regulator n=1 Tax=Tsukamurella strandjordii TaxID=147577 RepID=UPI0031CE4E40
MNDTPRRRDPERRRREIVDAAAALVLEAGPDALTHRKVATRAGVPLGSTTQYFATLDDLRAAALQSLMAEAEQWLAELEAEFVREGASSTAYTAALHRYLEDPQLVRGDFAVTCASLLSPELEELARHWTARHIETLSRYIPPENARAVAMLTDGATMDAVIAEKPMDRDLLDSAIAALWTAPLGATKGTQS